MSEFRGTPTTNAGKERPAESLSPDELDRLIAAADARSVTGVRARALIGVLYGAGLRVFEALALRPIDVDLEACTVSVRRGKGGKQRGTRDERRARRPSLTPLGCELLREWLALRASLGLGDDEPLFATYRAGHRGRAVTPQQARATLSRLGKRAGIRKAGPVHPHMLRHTWTVEAHVPVRAALGALPVWQGVIAAALSLATIAGLTVLSARVYRGGSLHLGGRLGWRQALRGADG